MNQRLALITAKLESLEISTLNPDEKLAKLEELRAEMIYLLALIDLTRDSFTMIQDMLTPAVNSAMQAASTAAKIGLLRL